MRRLLSLMLLLAVPAAAAGQVVHDDGVGAIKLGMRLATVNRTLGEHMAPNPAEWGGGHCYQLRPESQPGLLLMFIDDRLRRIDVMAPGIVTERGAGLGDPVGKVERLYGKALQRGHAPYVDDEQVLTVPRGDNALRFETSKGKIAALAVGGRKEVQYIEGCL